MDVFITICEYYLLFQGLSLSTDYVFQFNKCFTRTMVIWESKIEWCYTSRAVWPDVELIGIQIFPKVAPLSSHCSFFLKGPFQNSPKITKYLGLFWKFICCQDFLKIAQSGHTGLTSLEVSWKYVRCETQNCGLLLDL